MDVATILIIINIGVSAIAVPLTLGIVDVLKRLRKSDCCGMHMELDRANSKANISVPQGASDGRIDKALEKISESNIIRNE